MNSVFAGIALLSVLLSSNMAHCWVPTGVSRTFVVGDAAGWTFNVSGWENGKNLTSEDTLVFKYKPGTHNVVRVYRDEYESCTVPERPETYESGNDSVYLVPGPNYFICGFPGHCKLGMKIAAITPDWD